MQKTSMDLLRITDGLLVSQALYAAARLGVADLLGRGDDSLGVSELAERLHVHEGALYRILRTLARHGVFVERDARQFAHSELSRFLVTGAPGSIRSIIMFRGSEYFVHSLGQILYSVETGQPARTKLFGPPGEYLRAHPDEAAISDDAMTQLSAISSPSIAAAYDFGAYRSVMDVGGGTGMLLAAILRAHPEVRGVLVDLPSVIERARQSVHLGGDLAARTTLEPGNFLEGVPAGTGCRALVIKNCMVGWDDEKAHLIFSNIRRVCPSDGVFLVIEPVIPEGDTAAWSHTLDIAMLAFTGGRARTADEFSKLLVGAGFRPNRVIEATPEATIIEAFPS